MIKIITIIGARPQFIKAATISREIKKNENIYELIIHTGQHFDANMSDIFFEQMDIPKPNYNLNINSLSHGAMTGQMLEKIEEIFIEEKPDIVLVYGDTNSTLAGALAAKKLHIKLAHVEAGLRSFNIKMPEEINRILTDRISDYLFCPTKTAINNLYGEGYKNIDCKIEYVGDVMYDAALFYSKKEQEPKCKIPENFVLVTIHRAENTNNLTKLNSIFDAINEISEKVAIILPLHPRTKKIIDENKILINSNVLIIDPVGYLEIIYLLKRCEIVMTDSGGMQKEAYFFEKNCITLREETEWVELVENGYNMIVGSNKKLIIGAFNKILKLNTKFKKGLYGSGSAASQIIESIL